VAPPVRRRPSGSSSGIDPCRTRCRTPIEALMRDQAPTLNPLSVVPSGRSISFDPLAPQNDREWRRAIAVRSLGRAVRRSLDQGLESPAPEIRAGSVAPGFRLRAASCSRQAHAEFLLRNAAPVQISVFAMRWSPRSSLRARAQQRSGPDRTHRQAPLRCCGRRPLAQRKAARTAPTGQRTCFLGSFS